MGDVCDSDLDGDGAGNEADNCGQFPNPDQADHEGDGLGDVCDADDDNDAVNDGQDNCPLLANPMQDDFDGDMLGDVCDADDDADGVADSADQCPATMAGDRVHPQEGCSVEQLCPCEGPMGGSLPWHGQLHFVRCVYQNTTELYMLRLISYRDRNRLVLEAVQSECGARPWHWPRRHGWCDRRSGGFGGQHRYRGH